LRYEVDGVEDAAGDGLDTFQVLHLEAVAVLGDKGLVVAGWESGPGVEGGVVDADFYLVDVSSAETASQWFASPLAIEAESSDSPSARLGNGTEEALAGIATSMRRRRLAALSSVVAGPP
jgi:hypothetical protein